MGKRRKLGRVLRANEWRPPQLSKNLGVEMIDQKILEKVEAKEFEHRCLNLNICPKCGEDLDIVEIHWRGEVEKVCDACGVTYWT